MAGERPFKVVDKRHGATSDKPMTFAQRIATKASSSRRSAMDNLDGIPPWLRRIPKTITK